MCSMCPLWLIALLLDFVKLSGVVAQDRCFVFLLQICALDDLVDFLHAVAERNLMREIGGEHERRRADALNGVSESLFVALAADEDAAAGKIVFRFSFELKTAVFQLPFQSIDDDRNPRGAAFEKADA